MGGKRAGLVLAVLGAVTYGATSAFGLVLCAEWLRDPDRDEDSRQWDWVGAVLAVPGVLFFAAVTVRMYDYAPGGTPVAPLLAGYWVGFAVWLLVRSRTRRLRLRAARDAGPKYPS